MHRVSDSLKRGVFFFIVVHLCLSPPSHIHSPIISSQTLPFPIGCNSVEGGSFSRITCVSGAFSTPAGFVQTLYGPPNTCPITSQAINAIAVTPTNLCFQQVSTSQRYICDGSGGASLNTYSNNACSGSPVESIPFASGCQPATGGVNEGPAAISCSSNPTTTITILNIGLIVGLAIGGALLIVSCVGVFYCKRKNLLCFKQQHKSTRHSSSAPAAKESANPLAVTAVLAGPEPAANTHGLELQGVKQLSVQEWGSPSALSSQPVPPVLPPGWTSLLDPSTGRAYYLNQSTKVTSWELPSELLHPL